MGAWKRRKQTVEVDNGNGQRKQLEIMCVLVFVYNVYVEGVYYLGMKRNSLGNCRGERAEIEQAKN